MKKITGYISGVDLEARTFKIKRRDQKLIFIMSRSQTKRLERYLHDGLFVQIIYQDKIQIGKTIGFEVVSFLKLFDVSRKGAIQYLNIDNTKETITKVLNKDGNKMFLDLEFSMPPYDNRGPFTAEIIQYGITIENNNGSEIFQEENLLVPLDQKGLSKRLFDFTGLTSDDFTIAISPLEFYERFKKIKDEYNPTIIVWGKNDILMLDKFYAMHNLEPLTKRADFLNLMQLIKNYYSLKNDLGLFNALALFDESFNEKQAHDALIDANVTSMVYHYFKDTTNNKKIR